MLQRHFVILVWKLHPSSHCLFLHDTKCHNINLGTWILFLLKNKRNFQVSTSIIIHHKDSFWSRIWETWVVGTSMYVTLLNYWWNHLDSSAMNIKLKIYEYSINYKFPFLFNNVMVTSMGEGGKKSSDSVNLIYLMKKTKIKRRASINHNFCCQF